MINDINILIIAFMYSIFKAPIITNSEEPIWSIAITSELRMDTKNNIVHLPSHPSAIMGQ